jgi:hypothetical protein
LLEGSQASPAPPSHMSSMKILIERPGREARHSPPSCAQIKSVWSYTSTSPYICFVAAGRGLRVAMATPAIGRRRTASCLRTAVFLFLVTFVWLQLHVATLGGSRQTSGADGPEGNDSTAAILSMVPQVRLCAAGARGPSVRHCCSSYVLLCHAPVPTSMPSGLCQPHQSACH